MIIRSLVLEDFRKYDQLRIDDLPEQGLIAVVGGNESGKSSIGDALRFALYGRVSPDEGERLSKLVRWGAGRASVALTFSHDGYVFRLTRTVNQAGEQTAVLWSVDDNITLADTVEQVRDYLLDMLGYGYPAFMRTFYWDQQLSAEAGSDAESLQAMSGVQAYAKLSGQLAQEQAETERRVAKLQRAQSAAQAAQTAIDLDEAHLPHLVSVRDDLDGHQQQLRTLTSGLNQHERTYRDRYDAFHEVFARSRWVGRLALWGVIALVLMLVLWGVLYLAPHWLTNLGMDDFVNASTDKNKLLWGATVLALLSGLALLYGWSLDRKLAVLRQDAGQLADALQQSDRVIHQAVSSQLPKDAVGYLKARALLNEQQTAGSHHHDAGGTEVDADGATVTVTPTVTDDETGMPFERAVGRVREFLLEPAATVQLTDHARQALTARQQNFGHYTATIEGDVSQEKARVDQFMALSRELAEQTQQHDQAVHEQQMQTSALSMLQQASEFNIGRFNQAVQQRCRGLLSDFTQSHYDNLEIDADFALHVLSKQKGDFLEFDEISAGTQRQISLAMRLALANALAENTDADAQFVFLDEPFAFFDPARTQAALASFRTATEGRLQQIWLALQVMPEEADVDKMVHCTQ